MNLLKPNLITSIQFKGRDLRANKVPTPQKMIPEQWLKVKECVLVWWGAHKSNRQTTSGYEKRNGGKDDGLLLLLLNTRIRESLQ